MTANTEADKPRDQAPETSANKMDRPLPGSDGPVPNPTASGFAQPIEATERASGVDPGNPTPTQEAEANQPQAQQKP